MNKLLGYIIAALIILCFALALAAGIVFFAGVITGGH